MGRGASAPFGTAEGPESRTRPQCEVKGDVEAGREAGARPGRVDREQTEHCGLARLSPGSGGGRAVRRWGGALGLGRRGP